MLRPVISFPGAISRPSQDAIEKYVNEAMHTPGRPIVLMEGATISWIDDTPGMSRKHTVPPTVA